MEVVLLCLLIAVLIADQMALTGILHRPLVACTAIGAVLGNAAEGAVIGCSLELMQISYEQTYRFTEKGMNFVLYSAVACIFAIKAGMDTTAAVTSSVIFAALGTYVSYLVYTVNTAFLPMARKAAELRNEKKLTLSLVLPLVIACAVNCALAVIAYNAGEGAAELFAGLTDKAGWILNGLSAAGVLLPCIGFAVLLRNINAKDVPAGLAGGAAFGALLSTYFFKGFGVAILILAAFAIGAYDYQANKKTKETGNSMKGGAEKWW